MTDDKDISAAEAQKFHQLVERLQHGQLEPQEQQLFSKILEKEPGALLMSVTRQQLHIGPLPPPDLLNQYDDRTRQMIVEMASKEQAHAHLMQHTGLQGAIDKDRRGQVIGGVIAVSGLIAAAVIAPHSATAAAVIGGARSIWYGRVVCGASYS